MPLARAGLAGFPRALPMTATGLLARLSDLSASRDPLRRRLCVLNYHRVLPEPDPLLDADCDRATFLWQMRVLAEGFNVLPLGEALQAARAGALPPRAVAITFDDGYRSLHELALPILRHYGLSATAFVTTGFLSGQDDELSMWNDVILDAVRTLPGRELDLSAHGLGVFSLRDVAARKHTALRLTEGLKYLPWEQRQALIAQLRQRSDVALRPDLMLTPPMVRELARNGWEIGAHTVSHPILTCMNDADAAEEIRASKAHLESIIDAPVRYFAYPNGKPGQDFDDRHVEMARAAGYEAAFTTVHGLVGHGDDPFRLQRSRPWDRSPLRFTLRLLRWLSR
jgi:peptidoglycan/xylan/chitin deacetylase (PgdA/CDA1 family)